MKRNLPTLLVICTFFLYFRGKSCSNGNDIVIKNFIGNYATNMIFQSVQVSAFGARLVGQTKFLNFCTIRLNYKAVIENNTEKEFNSPF
jgi:hypothetical protein